MTVDPKRIQKPGAKNETVSLRVPPGLWRRLKRIAKQDRRTANVQAVLFLEKSIEQAEGAERPTLAGIPG